MPPWLKPYLSCPVPVPVGVVQTTPWCVVWTGAPPRALPLSLPPCREPSRTTLRRCAESQRTSEAGGASARAASSEAQRQGSDYSHPRHAGRGRGMPAGSRIANNVNVNACCFKLMRGTVPNTDERAPGLLTLQRRLPPRRARRGCTFALLPRTGASRDLRCTRRALGSGG